MFINNPGHMTRMAAMPINGKNPSKFFFSGTTGPISPEPLDRFQNYSKIFFSETTWPIKAQFYRKHLWEGGINVFINNPGHMTKMAAMPIYGKDP